MSEPVPETVELQGSGLFLRPYRQADGDALFGAVRESVASVGRWLPIDAALYALIPPLAPAD
jgi:hypothetical protein